VGRTPGLSGHHGREPGDCRRVHQRQSCDGPDVRSPRPAAPPRHPVASRVTVSDAALAPTVPVVPVRALPRERGLLVTVLRFCRRNPLVAIGAVVVIMWIVLAVFAAQIAPYGPLAQKVTDRLKSPSVEHLF